MLICTAESTEPAKATILSYTVRHKRRSPGKYQHHLEHTVSYRNISFLEWYLTGAAAFLIATLNILSQSCQILGHTIMHIILTSDFFTKVSLFENPTPEQNQQELRGTPSRYSFLKGPDVNKNPTPQEPSMKSGCER